MISVIIKYNVIVLCAYYIYTVSQGFNKNRTKNTAGVAISLFIGTLISILRELLDPYHIAVMILLFVCIYKPFFNVKTIKCVVSSVLSFGISYAAFVVACFATAVPLSKLSAYITDYNMMDTLTFSCIGILQIIITALSLKSKRIKSGLAYLMNLNLGDIGIYLSIALLITMSAISLKEEFSPIYLITFISIAVCSLTLFFWRKNQITRLYIDQTKNKEISMFEQTIEEKDKIIESLREDNDNLSKIIHKDNKLIPAMILAVKKYISESEKDSGNTASSSEAADILKQLESIYSARMNAVKSYELNTKKLPVIGIVSTDAVTFYMQQKAAEFGVSFDLCISTDVKQMIENTVEKNDLNTLLADLIENAIIATKKCADKFVMVSINCNDSVYNIEVYDSGENFDTDVLKCMGRKRITTHTNDGGSGIGMMSTFEILSKYSASFLIEEYSNRSNFSKKVQISFDSMNNRQIITHRYQELENKLKYSSIKVLEKS